MRITHTGVRPLSARSRRGGDWHGMDIDNTPEGGKQVDSVTLREAADLLGINQKTLDGWLKRAGIVPEPDTRDRRRRLVTNEQLNELAAEYGRPVARHEVSEHALAQNTVLPLSSQELLAWESNILQKAQASAGRTTTAKIGELRDELAGRIDEQEYRIDSIEVLFETVTRCVAVTAGVSPLGPTGVVIAKLAQKFGLPYPGGEPAPANVEPRR